MCGICGIWKADDEVSDTTIKKMMNIMKHRGPDDEGMLIEDGIGLGHVRLRIIDLTKKGRQPMPNNDETLWIVYNGEIYNYIEIREELRSNGYDFRSTSDTEVLLKAYEHWGEKCISKLNGMFSFLIYDKEENILFAARDRFGIKPFYYYRNNHQFIFASEIKPLLSAGVRSSPNRERIHDFLIYQLIPEHKENTFFSQIKKLLPGHYLKFDLNTDEMKIIKWWKLNTTKRNINKEGAIQRFSQLLGESVNLRLRSDVLVGTCLSGGLDSSSIVCKMVEILGSPRNVKSFSSVFSVEFLGNEKKQVREVVRKTGIKGYETEPNAKDVVTELKSLVYHQEEPFFGMSPFAQWEVMKLARNKKVNVLLDGQGADEILAGYLSYFGHYFAGFLKKLRFVALYKNMKNYKGIHGQYFPLKDIIYVFEPGFLKRSSKRKKAYYINRSYFKNKDGKSFPNVSGVKSLNKVLKNSVEHNLLNLLRFEDKSSMAFGIETRLPFLDYRLVEFLFSLNAEMKLRNGKTKYVLREAMKNILPKSIYNRHDKVGFAAPEDIWLNNRKVWEYIKGTLLSDRTISRGIYSKIGIERLLANYLEGDLIYSRIIWSLVNLELWFRMYMDGEWEGFSSQ